VEQLTVITLAKGLKSICRIQCHGLHCTDDCI